MTTTTLRKLLFGTLALATLMSVLLTGGTQQAAAVSIHKPNLVVTSIVTKPNRHGAQPCVAGSGNVSGPATMFITISNTDPIANAGASIVEFQGLSLTANLGMSGAVPAISGGGQVTVQLPLPDCQVRGWAFVDITNVVVESNESDNRFDIVMF